MELEETIYMSQPEGFKVAGKEDYVCLLKKSLYGLKQSPKQWYRRFDTFITKNGFNRSSYDSCVYVKGSTYQDMVYLLLYVDDMLLASKKLVEVQKLKMIMQSEFDMKNLGKAQRILGMDILRNEKKDVLFLSQKEYLDKVIKRFGMVDAKPVSVPLSAHFKLSAEMCPKKEEEVKKMAIVPYTSAIGSVMYAMVCPRPGIAQSVSLVSRYMSNLERAHCEAVKRLLRHLKGSLNTGLLFKRSEESTFLIKGYVDDDYVGDLDKRRSSIGYIFTLGGGCISWKSQIQSIVALSTTESEYIAVTECIEEAFWVKGITAELGIPEKRLTVFCDSQSAIHLSRNQMYQ
ncbi:hypothetical protein LWI28_028427 [Acer negundo]|uniref:Reverse transcriptase Ty1/copia-type domain-containing protein n=1 Tax=Acer negundo TaxID=4023 RepID=A0AAD5J7V0_ACENE|nr:hypothetical protein LWI28_028427 [Acer negundo]